jgi:ankyrin repeat protein
MLMVAAAENHLDIVEYLLDKGANAHHQDQCGM